MFDEVWRSVLIAALVFNAALALGYRVYRYYRRGPVSDVIGQALLAAILVVLAAGVATEAGWARWTAFAYAVLWALVVTPVWVLAVLIPLPPGRLDYAFVVTYWLALVLIAVAALAA